MDLGCANLIIPGFLEIGMTHRGVAHRLHASLEGNNVTPFGCSVVTVVVCKEIVSFKQQYIHVAPWKVQYPYVPIGR